MRRLQDLLQSKYASIACIIFAVANRIVFTTLYSQIGSDTKIQLTYAQNLLAGKGMGVTKYFTNDLNTPVFDTHQWFPPGFSLIIIPFLKLTGGNEFRAVLVFDIVIAILFVIAVRSLGRKAGLPTELNNIITLIAGCSQYIFFMAWSATDAISVCFLLFALSETIGIINKNEDISLWRATACAILFCLPFFFRYMYLPMAVLLPFLTLFSAILSKSKKLKSAGLKLLVASISFLVFLLAFNFFTSGSSLFVHEVGRGFYFHQLAHWYPFLPASVISLDFAAQLIENISGLSYSLVMFYFEIINGVLFVLLLFLLWRYLAGHKKNPGFSTHSLFIVIGSFISITILLLLAYLTLTYQALPWGLIRWTHSQHARYFSFIYVFLPLLLLVCLYHYASSFRRFLIRILVFIPLCCLGIEVLHGIYYNIKIVLSHSDLALIRNADEGYRKLPAVIAEIEKQNPGRQVIVSSPDQYYLHAASQAGYKAIFDYENLWRTDLKASSKSILLMPVHQQEYIIMKEYIEKKRPQIMSTIAGTYFYVEEINPR